MIDYAKVSRMIEYQKKGVWPLGKFAGSTDSQFRTVVEDAL